MRPPALHPLVAPVGLGALVGLAVAGDPRLPVLLAGAGVGLWAALRRPELLVGLMFASILMDRAGGTGATIARLPVTASKLSVLGSLGLWALHGLLRREPVVRLHPVLLGLGGMVLSTWVAIAWSSDFDAGRFALLGAGMVAVLTGLVYAILAERPLEPLARGMAAVLLAALAASIIGGTTYSDTGRATGTFGDPNEWAALVLLVSPVILGVLIDDPHPLARLLRLGLMGLVPLAVLASGSRSALMVGALITPGLVWALRGRQGELLLCAALGLVAAPLAIDLEVALERLLRLFGRAGGAALVEDSSLDERGELLRQGLELFSRHWGMGAGPGRFAVATGFLSVNEGYRPAHNTYLELASEQGVFGLGVAAVAAGLVVGTLRRAWQLAPDDRHRHRVLGAASGLFAVGLMAATLGLLTFSVIYLTLGIVLAVTHQASRGER